MTFNFKPLGEQFAGIYFDGNSSLRQAAQIRLTADSIRAELAEYCFSWPYSSTKLVSDGGYGDPVRLEAATGGGAALLVEDRDFLEALSHKAPQLVARPWWDIRLSGWPAIFQSGAGVAILGSLVYYFGIALMAEAGALVAPRSIEERMGVATVNMIAPPSIRCQDATRTAILNRVTNRLFAAANTNYRFEVIYARLPYVNAFAAPGGKIVVTDYLVRFTETPEEFAGVLAHEIQHVVHRDSMRQIARQYGGRAILALLSVDSSGTPMAWNQATSLMDLSHSRATEENADRGAVALLERARIPADGLARFLDRLDRTGSNSGSISKYISTHPETSERVEMVRRLAKPGAPTETLVTPEEWKQARDICSAR